MGGFGNTIGLYFEIAADPSNAKKALDDFQSSTARTLGLSEANFTKLTTGIEKNFGLATGSLARTGMAAQAAVKDLAYLGAGAAALLVGAVALADKWASVGTAIFEAAEKTGIGADKLSGLRATTQVLGESFDGLTLTLSRMGKNIEAGLRDPSGEAGKNLHSLFKSTEDLRELGLKPLDERIALVNQRIFALNSVSQQNLALTALAGRGYNEVRSTLQELGREGYDPLIERAKRLGQFFDAEAAARARQFKIELASLKAEASGLALVVGQQLVPTLSELAQLLSVKLQTSVWRNARQGMRDLAAGAFDISAQILTAGGAFGLFEPQITRATLAIAGGRQETQRMTSGLIVMHQMVQAAAKGTGELGDAATKTQKSQTEVLASLTAMLRATAEEIAVLASVQKERQGLINEYNRSIQAADAALAAAVKEAKGRKDAEGLKTAAVRAYNDLVVALAKETDLKLKALQDEQDARFADQWKKLIDQGIKLREQEAAWADKAIASIHRETTEVQGLGAAWEETLARQTGISASTWRMIHDTQQMGITTAQLRQEFIRTYVLGLPSQLNVSRQALIQWANDAKLQISTVEIALLEFREAGQEAFGQLSRGMASSIADAMVYEKSIGKAMAAAAKSALASIAAEAIVRAIYCTALGFLRLAQHDYVAAGQAFTSAAIWGTIGGVAAAVGRAIPGGEAVTRPEAGGTLSPAAAGAPVRLAPGAASAAAREATGQGQQGPAQVTIVIQGDYLATPQSADHLIGVINDAVQNRDVRLVSTHTMRPAPAVR